MSKPKVFEKPIGVRDYLPEAVTKLRSIESKVLACMQLWGYRQIITPTLEYYDTVGVASSTSDKKLFKLLDRYGSTLVLRSEMTAPIARVVSSLLKNHSLPLRLSYHSQVFRAIEAEAGRDAEFFQTGVELIGDASPEADAEVIALAIASLQAAGVTSFKIALGHVGFLNGLFQEILQHRYEAESILKSYLLKRDHVGYREAIQQLHLEDSRSLPLEEILRLRGGIETCQKASIMTRNALASQSISHLSQVWDVLHAYGVTEHVMIDLTMIGDFSYYSGMVFEGYASDHAFPVCSGGRYDNLLSHFGRACASTGFALKTNRILELFDDIDAFQAPRTLIMYDEAHRIEALQKAMHMRSRDDSIVVTKFIAGGHPHFAQIEQKKGCFHMDGEMYHEVLRMFDLHE